MDELRVAPPIREDDALLRHGRLEVNPYHSGGSFFPRVGDYNYSLPLWLDHEHVCKPLPLVVYDDRFSGDWS